MNLEMNGVITKVLEKQTGVSKAGKEWVKLSFVIDNGNQYNNEVCFNIFGQEKVDKFQKYHVGNPINVKFNLSSREYNGNYYTSCDAWKIEDTVIQQEKYDSVLDEEKSDLPF